MATYTKIVDLKITYFCPQLDQEVTASFTVDTEESGPCWCEAYCYCQAAEVTAEIQKCPACGNHHSIDIKYFG